MSVQGGDDENEFPGLFSESYLIPKSFVKTLLKTKNQIDEDEAKDKQSVVRKKPTTQQVLISSSSTPAITTVSKERISPTSTKENREAEIAKIIEKILIAFGPSGQENVLRFLNIWKAGELVGIDIHPTTTEIMFDQQRMKQTDMVDILQFLYDKHHQYHTDVTKVPTLDGRLVGIPRGTRYLVSRLIALYGPQALLTVFGFDPDRIHLLDIEETIPSNVTRMMQDISDEERGESPSSIASDEEEEENFESVTEDEDEGEQPSTSASPQSSTPWRLGTPPSSPVRAQFFGQPFSLGESFVPKDGEDDLDNEIATTGARGATAASKSMVGEKDDDDDVDVSVGLKKVDRAEEDMETSSFDKSAVKPKKQSVSVVTSTDDLPKYKMTAKEQAKLDAELSELVKQGRTLQPRHYQEGQAKPPKDVKKRKFNRDIDTEKFDDYFVDDEVTKRRLEREALQRKAKKVKV